LPYSLAVLFAEGFIIDGKAFSCGYNTSGELGLGDVIYRSSPVQIGSDTNWKQLNIGNWSFGIKTNGTLWQWGFNSIDAFAYSSPVQIGTDTDWAFSWNQPGNIRLYSIKNNGTIYWMGTGTGTANNTWYVTAAGNGYSPSQIGVDSNWKSIATNSGLNLVLLKTDNTLWVTGNNSLGQLGQNNTINRSSPVQVPGSWSWADMQSHVAAIKTDGTLWTWGQNTSGQLGLGNVANISSPVQVGTANNWVKTKTRGSATYALNSLGELWVCGLNSTGQLGRGNLISMSSPVQTVLADTNWVDIAVVQAGVTATRKGTTTTSTTTTSTTTTSTTTTSTTTTSTTTTSTTTTTTTPFPSVFILIDGTNDNFLAYGPNDTDLIQWTSG